MKLGISSYTYAWSAGVPGYPAGLHPLTHEGLLERAVALSVPVVQIADNLPLDALDKAERRVLARCARDHGLEIEVGTRGIEAETLRRNLDIAVEFGSPILRTLIDSPVQRPTPQEAVAALRQAAPDFKLAGVALAIENHDRFRAATLREIIEDVGSEYVGICLDTANSLGCGEGIDQVLDALAERVVNLHVKDFIVRRLPHNKGFIVEGSPAGQGQLSIPAVLEKLRQAGRDVNAILELWAPPEAALEASIAREEAWAAESVRYLRTLALLRT
ncbi:MAG: sugar phosphate isomerase/epimerase [Acidobacteria bacterium]|nr:sugar phosphate isomerase/epimerase [Acidobacteriota bacterium]